MDIKKITEQEVNDLISKEKIDLSSFEVRSTLNPKIYDVDQHMHEEIRRRLLMIADDFFETLKVEWVDIQDIILTGSLANYNWSKFSDVDLHILIDFEESAPEHSYNSIILGRQSKSNSLLFNNVIICGRFSSISSRRVII